MGSFLDKPKTEKDTHVADGNGLRVGVSAMQGWRIDMEDAHTVRIGLPGHPEYSWFAVYDGHGGRFVSNFTAAHAVDKLMATKEWREMPHTAENLAEAMRKTYLDVDAELLRHPVVATGEDHSGSTAIAALVTPTHIIVANVGDSRCMLVRNARAVAMSEDHKPYNPGEEARIVAAGGTVAMRRVNGDLAVSRALGDFVYKHVSQLPPEKQQVSPEPEMQAEVREAADEYLVLACDGVWDVMTNDDVAAYLHKKASEGVDDMGRMAELLIDECLEKNSRDNMSAIIIAFQGAPRPSKEAADAFKARESIHAQGGKQQQQQHGGQQQGSGSHADEGMGGGAAFGGHGAAGGAASTAHASASSSSSSNQAAEDDAGMGGDAGDDPSQAEDRTPEAEGGAGGVAAGAAT